MVMSIPIITTKLQIPALPAAYVPRPRLDALWNDWVDKRLVLVTAGAGFGKTSFLAANARASDRRCFWYALDTTDSDLPTFCMHLHESVCGGRDDAALEIGPSDENLPDRVLASVVRFLRPAGAGEVLVLDDVHLVSHAQPILHYLERLTRFLPQGATLVLSSRETVGVATMRLRSLGDVATVGSRELAFTPDEVGRLFETRFPGVGLDSRLCKRIIDQTEGWTAGLQILFQVLRGSSAAAIEQALESMRDAGSGWFAYFAEEVVGRLDPTLRDFLYRTSVLPRLSPELCDEVLKIDTSRAAMEELSARNMFTFPCGDDESSYRYHHLFRDFLRDRLARELKPRQVEALYRRAAAALRKTGAWADAAAAHVEGGDPAATLRLFERKGDELLATGQYETIRHALESVPAAMLKKHSGALYLLGRIHDIQGRWDEAESHYRRALRIASRRKRRIELMSLIAQLKMKMGEYRSCVTLCKKALSEPGTKSTRARGRMLGMLGVSACDVGKLSEGEDYLKQAMAIFKKKKDVYEEGRILYLLAANVHGPRGEFALARSTARRSVAAFRKLKDPRRVCHSLSVLGWILAAGGDEREARELTEDALRMAENLEYMTIRALCHYTLGRCALIRRDLDTAHGHFDTARELGEKLGEAELRTIPYLGLGEVALGSGNRHAARRHTTHALTTAREMKDRLLEARCLTLLGTVEITTRPRRSLEYWRDADRLVRKIGAFREIHRLLLLRLASGKLTRKDSEEALRELLAGTARMDHENLYLVFEPERAAGVLASALEADIEVEYASGLVKKLGQPVVPHLAPLASHASDTVRQRAVELLAHIGGDDARAILSKAADATTRAGQSAMKAADELARMPTTALRIKALGSLEVSLADARLGLEAWKSRRALRLLQLLLAHRFRWVPQDVILEALWPDATPEKAVNSLRQTVFLLRKTLEPDLKEARYSRYVLYRNEACRLEAGEGASYDVADFETALNKADTHWASGKRGKAAEFLSKAVRLYRGNYLAESPYEEFTVVEREQLRDRLIRALGRLLEVHTVKKRWDEIVPLCRRGLAEDKYSEDFYWHLVHAHLRLKNRREALDGFHQYEQMMIGEMDLLPSERMKALADKVVALGR